MGLDGNEACQYDCTFGFGRPLPVCIDVYHLATFYRSYCENNYCSLFTVIVTYIAVNCKIINLEYICTNRLIVFAFIVNLEKGNNIVITLLFYFVQDLSTMCSIYVYAYCCTPRNISHYVIFIVTYIATSC